MEIKDTISIAKDFHKNPGARYKYEGKNSGEEFLEQLLLPKFEKAVSDNYILLIDLNDVLGYPSSFVSGSFGKLSLDKGADLVLKHLNFKSNSQLKLEKIINEIQKPTQKSRKNQ